MIVCSDIFFLLLNPRVECAAVKKKRGNIENPIFLQLYKRLLTAYVFVRSFV